MLKLGVYTGRKYPWDMAAEEIGECYIVVTDDGPANEEILNRIRTNRKSCCPWCNGCREAKRLADFAKDNMARQA